MCDDPFSFYARWRTRRTAVCELHEVVSGRPPEILLQNIWARQRLKRQELRTTTGEPVVVLHPGFWNREAGPDFSGAVIRFGSGEVRHGDVEIDLSSAGWKAHGHDRSARFREVVLHVVWETSEATKVDLPTVVLKDLLDSPVDELYGLLEGASPPPLALSQQGRCRAPLQRISRSHLETLLAAAARVRLESRASQIRARAKQVGWEQTLIEGMFRALGYKNNAWPMQHLGEISAKIRAGLATSDPLHWQAALLGTGALLPDQLGRKSGDTDQYLKRIWDVWWRERDRFESLIMPGNVWRLSGVRPANHPQRRLALAAHWLSDAGFFSKLEMWFAETMPDASSHAAAHRDALFEILNPDEDPFWLHYWTLRSNPLDRPQPLLGNARVSDLAMNAVLPWFFTRATTGNNASFQEKAERIWFSWPKAEDNALLRQARARLLGNAGPRVLKTAAHQQGLLQIIRDYCDHSNSICEECTFPTLVADWQRLHLANQ